MKLQITDEATQATGIGYVSRDAQVAVIVRADNGSALSEVTYAARAMGVPKILVLLNPGDIKLQALLKGAYKKSTVEVYEYDPNYRT